MQLPRIDLRFIAIAIVGFGCEREVRRVPTDPPAQAPYEEVLSAAPTPLPVGDEAREPSEDPPAIALVEAEEEPPVLPAALRDRPPPTPQPIAARRYVFRVRLAIPAGLGEVSDAAPTPAAELIVDVSNDRLRARFEGAGWPIDPGSEVRLRRDAPGVYIVDSIGGRPLEGGRLADWFEGGPRRPGPPLSIRRDPAARGDVPGALICALLAEWAGEPRGDVMARCELGAPVGFRMALWRAERTADVPLTLSHDDLRADEEGVVVPRRDEERIFIEPEALGPLLGRVGPEETVAPSDAPAPAEGLVVENRSDSRLIVSVEGAALGWLAPGQESHFEGLRAGRYHLGAMRPLGNIALRVRPIEVPSHIIIPTPRRRRVRAAEGVPTPTLPLPTPPTQ